MDNISDLLENDDLPALVTAAERVAMSIIQGSHGRRRVGMGESFWQFRNYMPSDPVRSIDWRQTAKRDTAFIRQTEWEAAQTVILWHDSSASMDYCSDPEQYLTKKRYALLVLLSLASALLRGGETILIPGHRPVQGYPSLPHVADMLLNQDQDLSNLGKLPQSAHGIFVTDGLMDTGVLSDQVQALAHQRFAGQFIHIMDPAERTLPFSGHVVFEGMEEGEGQQVIQDVRSIRTSYQGKLDTHCKALRDIIKTAGWFWHDVTSDQRPDEAILPVFETLMVKG